MFLTASWSHQTTLPSEPRSAGLAREFVCAHLVARGLDGLVDDVRVVVSELATNAIVHAQTAFTVTLQGVHASILLQVRDGAAVTVFPLSVPTMGTGGRGLAIVDRLSDRWGTMPASDGGKSVWAWFDGQTSV